jgi:hypothetical protein
MTPISEVAALRAQLACIRGQASATSFYELRAIDRATGAVKQVFIPVDRPKEAMLRIRRLAFRLDVYIGALPRVRKRGTAEDVGDGQSLWADLDGAEARKRSSDFGPEPSLRIRTGSPDREHVYWPLREPISPDAVQRCNRRIALALGGDLGACDPARVLRPVASLNHKTDPPKPVVCTRLETSSMFTFDQVVANLPDTDHYVAAVPVVCGDRSRIADPSRALAGLVRTVASAQVENRNKTLYWAACRVRDHADRGEIDVGEARAQLIAAAESTGLSEFEIERTIRSALDRRAVA